MKAQPAPSRCNRTFHGRLCNLRPSLIVERNSPRGTGPSRSAFYPSAARGEGQLRSARSSSVFVPSLGLAEVVARGTLMYLALFVILRFIGRRQAGHFEPADLLVIVLIADAAQNGLGKEYQSVTEGVALVLTIVAWEYLLDWIAWRFPSTRRILKPPALTLVKDGHVIRSALRKEMLSEEELEGQLREQGVGGPAAGQTRAARRRRAAERPQKIVTGSALFVRIEAIVPGIILRGDLAQILLRPRLAAPGIDIGSRACLRRRGLSIFAALPAKQKVEESHDRLSSAAPTGTYRVARFRLAITSPPC
jgi:hypothetical protein